MFEIETNWTGEAPCLDSPFFSIIVPVFNRRNLITETLESIRCQTFLDHELILVDDGSNDGSAEYLRDQGFFVIKQGNMGPGAARNTGAKHAKGRYLAFLDSDDRWLPWSLKMYADVIQQNDFPAFVTGNPLVFQSNDAPPKEDQREPMVECFADYYSSSDRWRWFGVSSFVIRRDIFEQVGGFANGRINGEDAELAMRLGTAKGFVHIASPPTFAYLAHEGNVTLDSAKSEAGLRILIEGEKTGRYAGGPKRASQRREIITRHVRPFVLDCCRKGNLRIASRYYMRIFAWCLRQGKVRFLLAAPFMGLWGAIFSRARTRLASV